MPDVNSFELNMSALMDCPSEKWAPHGENPDILEEVCRWVMEVAKSRVAKMTPNVTDIEDPTRHHSRRVRWNAAIKYDRSVLAST